MSSGLRAVCGSCVRPQCRALQSSPVRISAQPARLCTHIRHRHSHKPQEASFNNGLGRTRRHYCSIDGTSSRNRQPNNVHTHALPATLLVGPGSSCCCVCIASSTLSVYLFLHALCVLQSIALTDESPVWTLDQIAGLVFGVSILCGLIYRHGLAMTSC